MGTSLSVAYRPRDWGSIVGQESTVLILKKQLSQESFRNAYIFSGASGTGKTTTARIFANAINKGAGAPIEIDAASNSGVDNIRNIIDTAKARALDSEYKIYILDEAHMLSTAAWNALLKIIEEPPKYTIFILCTTDPQKIPDTIKNRCMRFNFTRIPQTKIYDRLLLVCAEEGYNNYTEACDYISKICNGELRNALSMLETCHFYSDDLNINNVISALGNFSYDLYFDLINNIIDGNISNCIQEIDSIYDNGQDIKLFINNFLSFILDTLKYILTKNIALTKVPNSLEDKMKFITGIGEAEKYYNYYLDKLLDLKSMIKYDTDCKTTTQVVITQMCRLV